MKEIVVRMVAELKKNERRHRTIMDVEGRLNRFSDDFGDSKLSEITVEDLKEWLDQEEWAPRTRVNYTTKISQLYNYAIKHNWAEHNYANELTGRRLKTRSRRFLR